MLWEEPRKVFTSPLFKWLISLYMLFIILRHFFRKRANLLRVHTTERGIIFLKTSALRGLIKKICREVIPQSKSRVKICTCCRKIKIRVSVACSPHMQAVSTQLQGEIVRILQEEIGINNLGSVHVFIEKIIGPLDNKNSDNLILDLQEKEEQ
jgi:hypothetical protein